MKKITILLTALIFEVCMLSAQTATTPSGSGTSNDPYLITSLNDLYWISQNSSSWSGYFLQTADMDASATSSWNSGAGWLPIAPFTGLSGTYFSGTYNGGGHTISGLTIHNTSAYTGWGLFGVIWSGTVTNLSVINANVTGAGVVGIIAGLAVGNSVIKNCITSGTVSGSIGDDGLGNGTGGLVGGAYYYSGASTISDCYSSATVSSSHKNVGGLIGKNQSSITNCYATGTVTSSMESSNNESCVGGLVGDNQGPLSKSYATGAVSGQCCIGGLAGKNANRDGNYTSVTIDSCYATGAVTVLYESINNNANSGGLVGSNDSAGIKYSYATGNVVGLSNSSNVGGLAGVNTNTGTINYCYATGVVSGGGCIGGLIGQVSLSTIADSYARGNVTGTENNVGGLVGRNTGSAITNTYSTGTVYSLGCYGGILGSNENSASISNSFWDTGTSGLTAGCGYNGATFGATGKITTEMKTQSTFTDAGWNFSSLWAISSSVNNGYPYFGSGIISTITKLKVKDGLHIYPNPCTDGFTVDAGDKATTLYIYDLSGKFILTQKVSGLSRVNVSNLGNGVYVVKVNGKNIQLIKNE
jgi:hypothetical protein